MIDHFEASMFLKHMGCRLLLGLLALYVVATSTLENGIVSLAVILLLLGCVESVFASLVAYARLKDKKEKAQARKERLAEMQAANNYFDV